MGRSAYIALGTHLFEAEQPAQQFVNNDRAAIAQLAGLYDPNVPIHQNEACVAKAREIMAEREAEMKGGGRAFSQRAARGWSPPTLDDVEADQTAKDLDQQSARWGP